MSDTSPEINATVFCDWCGHEGANPCTKCCRRYESARAYQKSGVKIFFNPFRFSVEQNNKFLAQGYEVMPLRIPK